VNTLTKEHIFIKYEDVFDELSLECALILRI